MTPQKSKMATIKFCRAVDWSIRKLKIYKKKTILYVEVPLNVFNTVVLMLGLKIGSPLRFEHRSH